MFIIYRKVISTACLPVDPSEARLSSSMAGMESLKAVFTTLPYIPICGTYERRSKLYWLLWVATTNAVTQRNSGRKEFTQRLHTAYH